MSANFISMMERKEKYTHTHTKAPSSLFLQSPEPISQSRALFSLGEGAGELNAHPTALRPCVPGHEGKIFCRWLRNSPARNNKKKSPCLASPCMQPAAWALRMGQSLRGCCLGSILTAVLGASSPLTVLDTLGTHSIKDEGWHSYIKSIPQNPVLYSCPLCSLCLGFSGKGNFPAVQIQVWISYPITETTLQLFTDYSKPKMWYNPVHIFYICILSSLSWKTP